jgi:hypothetical protein
MHREREHVGIVPKDRGRAVAVVYVQVHDGRPPHDALVLQHANRDRDVIDQAEAFAMVREGVVKATAQMGRDVSVQRQPSGEHRAAGADP